MIRLYILFLALIICFAKPCLAKGHEKDFISNLGLDKTLFGFYVYYGDTILYLSEDTIKNDFIIYRSKKLRSIPYVLYFPNTVFESIVSFQNMIFEKPVCFSDVCFKKNAIFKNTVYLENVFFIDSEFEGTSDFSGASFNRIANFLHSRFNQSSFQDARFLDTAIFSSTEFLNNVNFKYTQFKKFVSFDYCLFRASPLFNGSLFPPKVDMKNISSQADIDLTFIGINDSSFAHSVNLFGSSIDRLRFNYGDFILYFDNELRNDQKNYLYQNLLSRFDALGFSESKRLLDLEYKKYLAFKDHSFLKRVGYYISKVWWNFGYNKSRILIITGCFLFVFFLINTLKFRILQSVYCINTLRKNYRYMKKRDRTFQLKDVFSSKNCIMSLYFTIILFFGIKFELSSIRLLKLGWILYLMVIYMTGLICLAFIIKYVISI